MKDKMADNHSKEIRSKNMSHIRSTNTKHEELVRKHTVIFVNGCFWHKHNCGRIVWPSSNIEYWIPKINRNVERDIENQKKLTDMGWKVLIVWECELKKTSQKERLEKLCNEIIS